MGYEVMNESHLLHLNANNPSINANGVKQLNPQYLFLFIMEWMVLTKSVAESNNPF